MTDGVSSAPQPGDLLADKFRVVRRLGSGGMGSVFEVEHLLTKHRRALKLMHRGVMLSSNAAVPRFLREVSAAGRIGNPHIIETFDAGQLPDGSPYIVMELLDGVSLAQLIESQPTGLSFELTREIICQVCDGIAAAHAAGIVHRDLKPDNLFLLRQPETGAPPRVKILDFGVSKFELSQSEAKLTASGVALGTPLYMAPEQLIGDPKADGRVDVYALGVVLYEMLVGRTPYPGPSFGQLVLQMHEGTFESVRVSRPELPAAMNGIIERALAYEPAARFADVSMLREALMGCELATAPTAAARGTTAPVQRRVPRAAAWAATTLGLLLLAAAWSGWRRSAANGSETSASSVVSTPAAHPPPLPAAAQPAPAASVQVVAQPASSPQAREASPDATSKVRERPALAPAERTRAQKTRAAEQGLVEENPL